MGGTYDPAEPQDRAIEPFQDYGHNHWHNSLFWGEGISDFSITGPGLIWGRGLSAGVGGGRPPQLRRRAHQPAPQTDLARNAGGGGSEPFPPPAHAATTSASAPSRRVWATRRSP